MVPKEEFSREKFRYFSNHLKRKTPQLTEVERGLTGGYTLRYIRGSSMTFSTKKWHAD
nr:MAG TPA: hypothetical protein [Caudoviricetes sp.]